MKITIDTKEDSHEDIKKILALLSQMVNKDAPQSNVFENPQSSELPNLMGMFDTSTPQANPEPAPTTLPKVELY
jgi:hypothetical protein